MEHNKKQIKFRVLKGVSSIIGGIFHALTMGTVFPIGNFCPYLISYIRENHPSIELGHGYFLLPILSFFLSFFGILGGVCEKNIGIIKTVVFGELALIVAAVLMNLSTSIFADYGIMILYGLGLGLSTMITGKNACMYFPSKRGLVGSISGSFVTLSAAGFNIIGELIINPNKVEGNPYYPIEIAKNIKQYFIFQIIVIGICTLLAVLFIVPYEGGYESSEEPFGESLIAEIIDEKVSEFNENGLVPDPADEEYIHKPKETETPQETDLENPKETKEELTRKRNASVYSIRHIKSAINSWRVWKLAIISFCMSFGVGIITTTFRPVGLVKKVPEKFLQIIGTGSFLSNCAIAPVWGFLTDLLNYRYILILLNILGCLVGFGIYFTLDYPWLFTFTVLLSTLIMSGSISTMPPHIMKVFGMKYSVEIIGIIIIFSSLSGLIGSGVAFTIQKLLKESALGYMLIYMIGGGFSAVALGFGIFEDNTPFKYDC